jgi:peptide/nickel transport system ATP-binding protein
MDMSKTNNLLEVQNLQKIFSSGFISKKEIIAVEDVSFSLSGKVPEILTIAGESGSGKSTIARLILGLIKPSSGTILYKGKDIWTFSKKEWNLYRKEVNAVFQDPYSSFNPFHKVEDALLTPIKKFHLAESREEAYSLVSKALDSVNLRSDEILGRYPHELSGGQLQRILLARVFLLKPKLIVADEPVSMIDASLRINILNIMLNYKNHFGVSFLYITHDLSTAMYVSNKIIIMYRGNIVESGSIDEIVLNPLHPYVQQLIDSIPVPDPEKRWKEYIELPKMEPNLVKVSRTTGCKFYDRCPKHMEICKKEKPKLKQVGNRLVACHLY